MYLYESHLKKLTKIVWNFVCLQSALITVNCKHQSVAHVNNSTFIIKLG